MAGEEQIDPNGRAGFGKFGPYAQLGAVGVMSLVLIFGGRDLLNTLKTQHAEDREDFRARDARWDKVHDVLNVHTMAINANTEATRANTEVVRQIGRTINLKIDHAELMAGIPELLPEPKTKKQ